MNLAKKFVLFDVALLTLVATLGGVSLWTVQSVRQAVRDTTVQYDLQDRAEALVTQIGWLQTMTRGADGATYRDVKYFEPLRKDLADLTQQIHNAASTDAPDSDVQSSMANTLSTQFQSALAEAATPPAAASPEVTGLEKVRQTLEALRKSAPGTARRRLAAAELMLNNRILWTCLWLAVVLVVSTLLHMRQYRILVRPLVLLRDDMRLSARREFKELVRVQGESEFREVAAYFNGLARDLAELYRSLEEKVLQRSRELVRSERLASVGFLAAGVAHEINNPLSVISGYAELAEKDIQHVMTGESEGPDAAEAEAVSLSAVLSAQAIIREEAFRCKEITHRLLSLARGGGDGREPLCIADVARQVATLTKGLKPYRNRQVILEFEPGERLEVLANPTEIKQVLLNLSVNALEAVDGERGEVRIGGQQRGGLVELYVADNGKGMSAETLDQIFEPFFTAKRGSNEPGTGLGLSISHAIVESHGGRLRAHSAGAGKGSRFVVSFPQAKVAATLTPAAV